MNADVLVDLCTPAGDALIQVDGVDTPVSPGSSVAAVAIANELKARTAAVLIQRAGLDPGARPEDVPVHGFLALLRHLEAL